MSENQKIVLEYLKNNLVDGYPNGAIVRLDESSPADVFEIYCELTRKEEFEVLAEFAKWGLEHE